MTLGGAVVAPIAWAAGRLLTHPVLPHAIAAPRRVIDSRRLGRISYYEDDGASGLPVVLLHDVGPAGSTSALRGLFDLLRAERPVVAPDLPGHGFSERRREPFARAEYVTFVEEIVADVSRRYGATVDIVAVGATGELAASAVARSARHVRSLTIVSPTGLSGPRRLERTGRRIAATPLGGFVAHHVLGSRAALRMTLSRRSNGPLDESLVRYANAAARQPRASAATMAVLSGALSDPHVIDLYDALRVPVCFVYGSDVGELRKEIDVLAAARAGVHRSEVRGARAMPHIERTYETADALRAFWRTLAVKPELRLIRGERASRGLGLGLARRGAMRGAPRRRSWT